MRPANNLGMRRQSPRPRAARWGAGIVLLAVLACLVGASSAQAEGPRSRSILGAVEPNQTAVVLQILALLTVLSLAPAMFIMVTSFTRMVIVLSFLRRPWAPSRCHPIKFSSAWRCF